jgi:hypothetical protein
VRDTEKRNLLFVIIGRTSQVLLPYPQDHVNSLNKILSAAESTQFAVGFHTLLLYFVNILTKHTLQNTAIQFRFIILTYALCHRIMAAQATYIHSVCLINNWYIIKIC